MGSVLGSIPNTTPHPPPNKKPKTKNQNHGHRADYLYVLFVSNVICFTLCFKRYYHWFSKCSDIWTASNKFSQFSRCLVSREPSTQAVDLFEDQRESHIFVSLIFWFIFTNSGSFRNYVSCMLNRVRVKREGERSGKRSQEEVFSQCCRLERGLSSCRKRACHLPRRYCENNCAFLPFVFPLPQWQNHTQYRHLDEVAQMLPPFHFELL